MLDNLSFNKQKRIHFSEPDERVEEAMNILRREGFEALSMETDFILHESLVDLVGSKEYLRKIDVKVLNSARKLRDDECDVVIGGNMSDTRDIILSGAKIVGLMEGVQKITSLMLMVKGEEVLGFSDCAVINNPTAEELSEISYLSAGAFEKITGKGAKIGLLSFATKGSATTLEVEKIQNTVDIIKSKHPQLQIDGPLQFDTAYSQRVAEKKDPKSEVAGKVNMFIFPTLDAGNIAYKVAEQLGGYQAVGPILLGISKPYLDLSRGCRSKDIVELAKISTLL